MRMSGATTFSGVVQACLRHAIRIEDVVPASELAGYYGSSSGTQRQHNVLLRGTKGIHMCFTLYVGSGKPLPLIEWKKEAPGISVESLPENQLGMKAHFSKPVVQYVGSTSGCGCDFPHWEIIQGQVLPEDFDPRDEDEKRSNHENVAALMKLLSGSGEPDWELYGTWNGDYTESPTAVKNIALADIEKPNFFFIERVFYRVRR